MKKLLVLFICFLFGLAAHAQVYRVVDENGNVTYTDQPPTEGAEPVEVRQPNTAPPPADDIYPEPPPPPRPDPSTAYKVAITSPDNETIIPRGPGNFSVSASVSPSLKQGHQLQLKLDGQPRQEPKSSPNWSLTNVFRGEHNITVAVIDGKGKQLAESDPVTVFVFRPSTNDSNRGPPNRPTPRN